MIDHNVRDDWPEGEPDWLKSLVSSLNRERDRVRPTALPLTVIAREVINWSELASGQEAWARKDNQRSLIRDLSQASDAIGPSLARTTASDLVEFRDALRALIDGPKATLVQDPGMRTDPTWRRVADSGRALLACLATDTAIGACWDDLVAVAKDRSLELRSHRSIADQLFSMLIHRRVPAESLFDDAVSTLSYGGPRMAWALRDVVLPTPAARVQQARAAITTPPLIEPVSVWLGYLGGYVPLVSRGNVRFMNANWFVPNAKPGRPDFPHKAELAQVLSGGLIFKVAEQLGEESSVDFLVRVDLGETTAPDAVERATAIVDTMFNVAVHRSGGLRPMLAQWAVVQSGRPTASSFMAASRETGFRDDHHGAKMTADALEIHAGPIADALAQRELPRFLAAALEAQTLADAPFSRAFALRDPSEADRREVIPLTDRVVQQVAAYAAMRPVSLFIELGGRWPHVRWHNDLRMAVGFCLLGAGPEARRVDELRGELYSSNSNRPWLLFLVDHEEELLALCRVESERGWIARMLRSTYEYATFQVLMAEYAVDAATLELRRARVRNALVHGNPVEFDAVETVREFAEFLSANALATALEAYSDGRPFTQSLAFRSDERAALESGTTAAEFWRDRLAGAKASEQPQ